MSITVDQIVV